MGYFLCVGEAFPSVGFNFDALSGLERVGACDVGRRDEAAEDFFDLVDSGEGFLGNAGRVFLREVGVDADLPACCHGDVGECEGGKHDGGELKKEKPLPKKRFWKVERASGFEPPTSTLARWYSTN